MGIKAAIACANTIVNRILKVACEKHGIASESFDEKPALIAHLQAAECRLVFIDESFDRDEKYEVVNALRALDLPEEPLIIFVRSSASKLAASDVPGVDYFLPIPFSIVKFEFILRSVLGGNRKLLYVGKEDAGAAALFEALKASAFDIFQTESPTDGLNLSYEIYPDLIMVRLGSQRDEEWGLLDKIKDDLYTAQIQVVMLSDDDSSEVIERCFELGANDTFIPPFDNPLYIEKITQLMTHRKKGKKNRALVIDDSQLIRNLIARMFKQIGFSVVTAENGKEGLETAIKTLPDIITCDYDMPVMNGWQFCTNAKQTAELSGIPIIMVTARGTDVDKRKGSVLGVVDYLTKPFREEDLKKCVSRALDAIKKQKERDAISKYVAQDVIANVGAVIDGVKSREPEEKFITIMFTDICSFTPKCEKMGPQAIVSLLNRYFDLMIRILKKNNAIIDKLIGDAIVVRFDSGNRKADALNAVVSAHEMLKALAEFNGTSEEPVEIRIGVNSGTVILGNIGCESFRLDYTMIGDNMNITQRLESQAPKMGCLIADSTYELVRPAVTVAEGIALSLKGKSTKVIAFPLVDVNTQR